MSEYFEGILDFVKSDPSIFLHSFTFADPSIASVANMDGAILKRIVGEETTNPFSAANATVTKAFVGMS